jgi:hypothetical protein
VLDCNQLPERSDRTQLCIDPPDVDVEVVDSISGGSDSMFESMTHNPEMVRLLEILRSGSGGSPGALAWPIPGPGPTVLQKPIAKGTEIGSSNRAHIQNQQQKPKLAGSLCGKRLVELPGYHGNDTVCVGRCRVDVIYRAQDKR